MTRLSCICSVPSRLLATVSTRSCSSSFGSCFTCGQVHFLDFSAPWSSCSTQHLVLRPRRLRAPARFLCVLLHSVARCTSFISSAPLSTCSTTTLWGRHCSFCSSLLSIFGFGPLVPSSFSLGGAVAFGFVSGVVGTLRNETNCESEVASSALATGRFLAYCMRMGQYILCWPIMILQFSFSWQIVNPIARHSLSNRPGKLNCSDSADAVYSFPSNWNVPHRGLHYHDLPHAFFSPSWVANI